MKSGLRSAAALNVCIWKIEIVSSGFSVKDQIKASTFHFISMYCIPKRAGAGEGQPKPNRTYDYDYDTNNNR
jgi:hypothetical protein